VRIELDGELGDLPSLEVWIVAVQDNPRRKAEYPRAHKLIVDA
jgi:hypothetical protein